MSTHQLDTSGIVGPLASGGWGGKHQPARPTFLAWSELSPPVQDYLTAMFESIAPVRYRHAYRPDAKGLCMSCGKIEHHQIALGYSDLAPETLDQAVKDWADASRYGIADGGALWRRRQEGFQTGAGRVRAALRVRFPPLTVALNDAGKVVFL